MHSRPAYITVVEHEIWRNCLVLAKFKFGYLNATIPVHAFANLKFGNFKKRFTKSKPSPKFPAIQ